MSKRNTLEQIKKMSDQDFRLFQFEYLRQKKGIGISYLLLFFAGWLGIHKVYLEKTDRALYHAGSSLCFLFSIWVANFDPSGMWFVLGALVLTTSSIVLLYDLFTLTSQTEQLNLEVEERVLGMLSKA